MEKKILKLSIFDKTYSITTSENEEQLTAAAKKVDELLRSVVSKTELKNEGRVAVLTALQLAFDLIKQKNAEEKYVSKVERIISKLDKELLVS